MSNFNFSHPPVARHLRHKVHMSRPKNGPFWHMFSNSFVNDAVDFLRIKWHHRNRRSILRFSLQMYNVVFQQFLGVIVRCRNLCKP